MSGFSIRVGGTPTRVSIDLQTVGNDAPLHFEQQKGETADPRVIVINFGTIYPVQEAKIQVLSINDQEPAHVHVWEITFLKP
jgi:hypothetical protein